MSSGYGLSDLMEFLSHLEKKALIPQNTASARRASCNKFFSILEDAEQSDLRNVDVEQTAIRFNNLNAMRYKPQTLNDYKSRATTALNDFLRFKDDPGGFQAGPGRTRAKPTSNIGSAAATVGRSSSPPERPQAPHENPRPPSVDVPVPLRSNCIVHLTGIPIDLKPSEAKKIAAVIAAMVAVDE